MKIAAFAGGVGGAKLVSGLAHIMTPADLTVIVNTGDDFELYGLKICPDLDTVCYTLAGIANPATGWGRLGDSFQVLSEIGNLKGETWFQLGDKDLSLHFYRTAQLQNGWSLADITQSFLNGWQVATRVLPMSNMPSPTIVETRDLGPLPFQEYFVKYKCDPVVTGFDFPLAGQIEPQWVSFLSLMMQILSSSALRTPL